MHIAEGWTVRKVVVWDDYTVTIDYYEDVTRYLQSDGSEIVNFYRANREERAKMYAALTGGQYIPPTREERAARVKIAKGRGVVFKHRGRRGELPLEIWATGIANAAEPFDPDDYVEVDRPE